MQEKQARSVDDIKKDIARSREALADSVADVVDRLHPKNIKNRAISKGKGFFQNKYQKIKAQFKDEDGWRIDRVVPIATGLIGIVIFTFTIFRVVRRKNQRNREL